MALYFETSEPNNLLTTFKNLIDTESIVTWSYDADGDFTHTPNQWIYEAWLRPRIENGRLAFYILNRSDRNISVEIYAIYHGRFIETMLVHCDKLFSISKASSMPEGFDVVSN